jgi:hypothetical protein
LEKIRKLRKQQNKDWYNSISEDEKQAIKQGLQNAESGKLKPTFNSKKTV